MVDRHGLPRRELRRNKDRFERTHFLDKLLPATGKRNKLFPSTAGAEVWSNFFEHTAEAPSRGKRTKAQHRVVTLLHAAMILLDRVFANDKSGFFRPPDWSAPRSGSPLPLR